MKYAKHITLVNVTVLFMVVICSAAGIISYHAYTTSQQTEEKYGQQLAVLKQDINRIEGRLTSLAGKEIAYGGATSRRTGKSTGLSLKGISEQPKADGSGQGTGADDDELMRLKQIIDSIGLGQLAEDGDVDLSFLKDMSDRRSRMMDMASSRRDLVEKSRELHAADEAQYDVALQSLYDKARFKRGSDLDEKEREAAFNQVVDKYPDSYAAASLIAERALAASLKKDTATMEKYHDMLLSYDNEDFRNVVTNRGAETMPAIEASLARQYIQDGRTEDAEYLLDSLEQNYSDSMIFSGRQGQRGPPFQSVSQVVQQLRAVNSRGGK